SCSPTTCLSCFQMCGLGCLKLSPIRKVHCASMRWHHSCARKVRKILKSAQLDGVRVRKGRERGDSTGQGSPGDWSSSQLQLSALSSQLQLSASVSASASAELSSQLSAQFSSAEYFTAETMNDDTRTGLKREWT